MAVIFSDDFNGAGVTTELSAWTPDVGTSWTKIWASSTQVFQVITAGNVRGNANAGDVGFMYTADATYPSANYEVQATFITTNSTITPFYLLARVADQENMYAVRLVLASGGNNAQLYKKVAGTWSTLGSAVTIADGSVVKLLVNGTTVEVYDDGVSVVNVTDSALSAAGKAGMAHGGGAELVTSTDDTRNTSMVDNFSVNDLGGGDTALVVAAATHAHTAENAALTQAFVLTVLDVDHASGAENVALTQAYLLAVADATHAHAVDSPDLTQAYTLTIAEAAHAHEAENVTLTQGYLLAVADSTHDHSAESVSLTQAYALVVADAEHAHTSENVDLTGSVVLVVADATHGHAAENVSLTQSYALAVSDATHSHTAEALALQQVYTLTVADSAHAHTAENVTLLSGTLLVVADVAHAHAADSLALTQAHLLAVAGVTHAHTAETLTLAQAYTLAVNSAAHLHPVDNVVLVGGSPYQAAPARRTTRPQARASTADIPAPARVAVIPHNPRGTDG